MSDRDYQQRTLEGIREKAVEGHKKILVVTPTGGGKGYMAARLMEMGANKDQTSIFFAAQRELIFQLRKQLDRLEIPCRVMMNGVKNKYANDDAAYASNRCHVIAKDTLLSRAFRNSKIEAPSASFIQIDECHGALAQTYQTLGKFYSQCISVGWTATPCRTDGRDLGEYYDCMVMGPSYKELQDDGFLVPCKVFAPDRPDLKGLRASQGDYAKTGLQERMNKDSMVGNIIKEWKENSEGRQTVAFASGIQHSVHIRDDFRRLLGRNSDGTERAEHLDGKTPQDERDEIMERIKDGRCIVLCNYGVAHTGVDCPCWKYLICARPTKSFLLWRQMGGRPQRPFEGHDHCMIQDHSDNCWAFGYPDEDVEWQLNTDLRAQELPRTERNSLPPPPGEKRKDPHQCGNCGIRFRGANCPRCGERQEPTPEEIQMEKKRLKELERQKINMTTPMNEKQRTWNSFVGICIKRGMSIGAASEMYRKRFGVYPSTKLQGVPLSSQIGMKAKDFYWDVIKPEREAAKAKAKQEADRHQLELEL